MLIDIHVHTSQMVGGSRPGGGRYPTPDELIKMMDAAGIDKAIVLSTISPECRYCLVTPEEVIQICERAPDRLIPFASIDPRMLTNSENSDFSHLLSYYKQVGCKGIGEYMPNVPLDHPLNMNVFKQVEAIKLPILFHLAPSMGGCYGCYDEPGLPRLESVLKTCPDLTLIGHSQVFWAEISRDCTEENRSGYPTGPICAGRVPELMREYPNLHGDLSARSGYNAITRDPEFGYRFLEEFQDRLYFGSDIADTHQAIPLIRYFEEIKQGGLISEATYEKITWQNAARLLGTNASYG